MMEKATSANGQVERVQFRCRRSGIFLKFGGASVLASRRRCALTRQARLVSSLAPPNMPPRWGWKWIWSLVLQRCRADGAPERELSQLAAWGWEGRRKLSGDVCLRTCCGLGQAALQKGGRPAGSRSGGWQMPHFFEKNDECGFLPKAATPGWK